MNKVTFTAARTDCAPHVITGWKLRCGAVLHKPISFPWQDWPIDGWVVSDPVSGFQICEEATMGAVLRTYRKRVAHYGRHWQAVLDGKRKKAMRRWPALYGCKEQSHDGSRIAS